MGRFLATLATLASFGLLEASSVVNHTQSDPQKLTTAAGIVAAAAVIVAAIWSAER